MTDGATFLTSRPIAEIAWILLTASYGVHGLFLWGRGRLCGLPLDRQVGWRIVFAGALFPGSLGAFLFAGFKGLVASGLLATAAWVFPLIAASFSSNSATWAANRAQFRHGTRRIFMTR